MNVRSCGMERLPSKTAIVRFGLRTSAHGQKQSQQAEQEVSGKRTFNAPLEPRAKALRRCESGARSARTRSGG
jgi:hypothetical protein